MDCLVSVGLVLSSYTSHYENRQVGEANVPFEVPSGWEWCTLGEICNIKGGKRIPRGKSFSNQQTNHIYLRVTNMKNNTILLDDLKYIDDDVYQEIKNYTISSDDLYLTIAGTIGNVGVIPEEVSGMNLTENAAKLTEIICDKLYLMYSLLSKNSQEHFSSKFHQVAQPKLSIETASSTLLSLPPLSEQHRIVDEIQKWFALIDAMESGKTDLLTSIKQAKSKILDLAICGKLVPQDPNDEPASELLKRLGISSDNRPYENVPFEVPSGWCWSTLGEVCNFDSGYAFSSDSYKQDGTPLVRISNIKDGYIDLSSCVYVKPIEDSRFVINRGDLLIAMSGATTGKMGVYDQSTPAMLNQRVGNLRCKSEEVLNHEYRNYFLASMSTKILIDAYGGAQPNISAKVISNYYIPVPPIAEQKRIVSKINELFSQLDKIESSLEA